MALSTIIARDTLLILSEHSYCVHDAACFELKMAVKPIVSGLYIQLTCGYKPNFRRCEPNKERAVNQIGRGCNPNRWGLET